MSNPGFRKFINFILTAHRMKSETENPSEARTASKSIFIKLLISSVVRCHIAFVLFTLTFVEY